MARTMPEPITLTLLREVLLLELTQPTLDERARRILFGAYLDAVVVQAGRR
jgi:hypothetical protein